MTVMVMLLLLTMLWIVMRRVMMVKGDVKQ
jgi:hypothetical protein